MADAPHPSVGPSPTPEHPELARMKEELAGDLTRRLFPDGERNKELQAGVKRALDKEFVSIEDQKKFELWLAQLSALDERYCLLQKSAPNDAQITKILGDEAKEFFRVRDEILGTLLEAVSKKPPEEEERNAAAFISGADGGTDKEISDIEKIMADGKPQKLRQIWEWRARIKLAKQDIHPQASPEDRAATLARLERMEAGLSVLENMDPIGMANADPVACAVRTAGPAALDAYKQLGYMNPDGTRRYDLRRTGNTPPPRDPVMMGLRGAGLAAGVFMFIASAIVILRKKRQGQQLGVSDALILPYGFLALKAAGINFGGATEKELDRNERMRAAIAAPAWQTAIARMGGGTEAAKAADAFSDLVSNVTKREEVKSALKKSVALTPEALEAFGIEKDNVLYKTLTRKDVTAQDRRLFLNTLLEHHIEEEQQMLAMVRMIEGPKVG